MARFFLCLALTSILLDPGLDLPVGDQPRVAPKTDAAEDDSPDESSIFGQRIASENASLWYVIDCSGSMSIPMRGSTRMSRAKAELTQAISALPENFRFNCLAYDCTSWAPFAEPVPATEPNKTAACAWVSGLEPGGGTGTGGAVAQALADKPNKTVVLLTDGDPNCYLTGASGSAPTPAEHLRLIREANTQRAALNVFGIDAKGTFRAFCLAAASENGGSYYDCP